MEYDAEDAFPNDSQESVDSDGDGVGDNADVFTTIQMNQIQMGMELVIMQILKELVQ